MKKTVAFLMVLTLILSLGASAFADTLFPDGQEFLPSRSLRAVSRQVTRFPASPGC